MLFAFAIKVVVSSVQSVEISRCCSTAQLKLADKIDKRAFSYYLAAKAETTYFCNSFNKFR